jgi:hypothetical protein
MLTIRHAQISVLKKTQLDYFRERMVRHLAAHFPATGLNGNGRSLLHSVDAAIRRARSYGFSTERDFCYFLNLCGAYGWDFELLPENEWMRKFLTSRAISNPSDRIATLGRMCEQRMAVAEQNRRAREVFGG